MLGLSWRSSAPVIASIVPGAISWPWRMRSETSRMTRLGQRDFVCLAVEGEDVAAQEDLAGEAVLERPHDHVAGARELGGEIVGQLDLGAH